MSIQPNRVMARMVDQVAAEPLCVAASRLYGPESFRDPTSGQVLEVVEVRGAERDAYATLFHLWAHGLRRFLDRRGQAAQFAGAASQAICDPISVRAWSDVWGARGGALARPSPAPLAAEGVHSAYRMIAGPCRASYAAESGAAWAVFYWEHGHDAGTTDRTPLRAPDPQ